MKCIARESLPLLIVVSLVSAAALPCSASDDVTFARDVQPLLARKCFACHGPDDEFREDDLRLDRRAAAVAAGALDPESPADSELLRRILSSDPDEQMPPPDAREQLTEGEKDVLRRWVLAGANYEQHWAFVVPVRPVVPSVQQEAWPRNPIDNFVLAGLERQGLSPSAEADPYTLVRRVYLDLTGLPPTPEQADAFVRTHSPDAWENLVDELLQSEAYGERWARLWLDLARYSDTNGYEKDRPRSVWPYRDWVIRAINDDMPWDQFTIEQIAGDMLPDATESQRIATGFHRNTMLNEEGGIDPLEYRFHAMVDRVATTGIVWLGLTTGCAQCHTHKYDPILHRDFYSMMALLDNADEPDLFVRVPEIARKREMLKQRIQAAEAQLANRLQTDSRLSAAFREWLDAESSAAVRWTTLRATQLVSNLPKLEVLADGSVFSSGDITKRDVFRLTFRLPDEPITAIRIEAIPDDRLPARGPGRAFYEGRKGDFFLSEVSATADDAPVSFTSSSSSIHEKKWKANNVFDGDGSTGWGLSGREGEAHQLVLNLSKPYRGQTLQLELLFERHYAASLGRFRVDVTSDARAVRARQLPSSLEHQLVSGERDTAAIRQYFLDQTPLLAEERKPIEALRRRLPQFPTTLVMQERPADNRRVTHRHHRGEYLSPREVVEPSLPSMFVSRKPPRNRLEFARWLVSEENPLAARVAVNRAWRAFFGAGLVRTSGDFGTQSDPPVAPELIDWLACEFMQNGWSMKQLHRTIVTSATYRQVSTADAELRRRDPENRLLARAGRFRLDAEMIRDVMLHGSGLLSRKMYGPGVYPPQPASVTALAYGATQWKPSEGEDRYRRSLYTFSKRTAPFAAFSVFDGPSGETCLARRNRSNTPLQALTLLNDQMYVEMARAAARQTLQFDGSTEARAALLFRRFVTRPPVPDETAALAEFYRQQQRRLQAGQLDARALAGAEASDELAAWTLVARAVMNLDEVINHQ